MGPGVAAPRMSVDTPPRDELLNGEVFYALREAQVLIEQWRVHYNTIRPHSALGYRPLARKLSRFSRMTSCRSECCGWWRWYSTIRFPNGTG
jgi:hypothetical protein